MFPSCCPNTNRDLPEMSPGNFTLRLLHPGEEDQLALWPSPEEGRSWSSKQGWLSLQPRNKWLYLGTLLFHHSASVTCLNCCQQHQTIISDSTSPRKTQKGVGLFWRASQGSRSERPWSTSLQPSTIWTACVASTVFVSPRQDPLCVQCSLLQGAMPHKFILRVCKAAVISLCNTWTDSDYSHLLQVWPYPHNHNSTQRWESRSWPGASPELRALCGNASQCNCFNRIRIVDKYHLFL